MNAELLTLLDRLSPSNQRLLRELIFKLAQLEQMATPEEYDAQLDYTTQIDPWLASLVNRGLSHHTIKHYGAYIRHFLDRYPHPRRAHINAFLAESAAGGKQPTTVANMVNALKSFFNYLRDVEVVSADLASRIQRPHLPRSLRKPPPSEQVSSVLEASKTPRHEAMVRLLVDCGLRVGELVTIRISNVDLEHRLLTVDGKGKKQRQVPVSSTQVSIISHQIDDIRIAGYDGDWLFPGQGPGSHASTDSVHSYLERLCRKVGIPRISPHQLRHYFATQMLSSGANLKVTSAILGHADASTTADIYWHILNQKELVDQHARFSPLREADSQLSTYPQAVYIKTIPPHESIKS
jgi:integrase/recombinase XerD